MGISKLRNWLGAGVVIGALALGGGLGLAQQPTNPPPQNPPAQPGAAPAPAGQPGATPAPANQPAAAPAQVPETPDDNVQQSMTKKAEISAAQMSTNAEGFLTKMRDVLKRVVQLQGIAHQQKDVIKLNCVNDKLLQIKQLVNIGESNKTNLDEAIARSDESARYDYYANITVANDQVQTLGAEAEQCIGQDLSFLGPTETTVEGGNEPDDPTASEEPQYPGIEPVPVSSPFI